MPLQRHLAVTAVLLAFAGTLGAQSTRPAPTPTPAPLRGKSLAEVAANIRLKKPVASTGRALVVTNENLAELAAGGELTEVIGTPRAETGLAVGAPLGFGEAGGERSREYWRGVYMNQVETIRKLEARQAELESQIPALWNQFYAWDDPAYRDGVIKPQLDAAMQELERIKAVLPSERSKLPQIMTDARRDGAEPGWFRDLPRP